MGENATVYSAARVGRDVRPASGSASAVRDRWYRPSMHDYSPEARIYWWTTFALGALVLGLSALQLAALGSQALTQVVVGIALAAATGLFPVRIPGRKTSIAGAEIFVFLLLLLHGPAAATAAVACESACGSYRTSRRWTSRLGGPAMGALAMYACGNAFTFVLGRLGGAAAAGHAGIFSLLLIAAFAYFACSTLLMASLISLKHSDRVRPLAILREHAWAALAFVASASISDLVYVTQSLLGPSVLLAAMPVVAMFLSTINLFFRQAEAKEHVQRERTAAAEREAADAARHVTELQASEQRFHSAFTHAAVGMMLVSKEGRILQTNEALRHQLGRSEGQLTGHDLRSIVNADDFDKLRMEIDGLLSGGATKFSVELRCTHSNGKDVWVALSGAQFSAEQSNERCLILQLQDMTARKQAEARLQHIAYHDGLTNLPNRGYFLEELDRAVRATVHDPDASFAVMFLDFDRFKLVNDSLGHGAGDELLITAATRLRKCLRASDLVARLGGDEFAILIDGFRDSTELVELAERLQRVLREPMLIGGSEISTSISIGMTTSALNYAAPEPVMRDADIAMYTAKNEGKGRFVIFDRTAHSDASKQLWMENELRHALATGQIAVHFQPIFDLRTQHLYGFEALARWHHPDQGLISPEQFVLLAEDTGLIGALGDRVLEASCSQLASWRSELRQAEALRLHINVSGAELSQRDYAERALRIIERSGMPAGRITLEITENVLVDGNEAAHASMERLRASGIEISVDDFGKGYSSLSAVEDLPIDELKIDRSFVHRLETGKGEAIINTVLALGRSLQKRVVVEGVETEAQLGALVKLGCEHGQGFFLGKPLPADSAEHLVRQSTPKLRIAYSR